MGSVRFMYGPSHRVGVPPGEYSGYLPGTMRGIPALSSVVSMTTIKNSVLGFSSDRIRRVVAVLMFLEALSLAVISGLHLSGVIGGGTKPYNPEAAGIAEAVIGVVLVAGGVLVIRNREHGPTAALAATGFAIIGFLVGLGFTISGGPPADVAYHATVLPLLVLTLALSVPKAGDRGSGSASGPGSAGKAGRSFRRATPGG